jgi:hypothetical protein
MSIVKSLALIAAAASLTLVAADTCGDTSYEPSKYYCFDGDFLCPNIGGEQYLRCGDGCYSAKEYE